MKNLRLRRLTALPPLCTLALFQLVAASANAKPKTAHGTTLSTSTSEFAPFTRVADPYTEGLAGAAWLDYDGDDDQDLFLTNGRAGANALFRNDGGSFTEVAAAAGVQGEIGGAAAGAVAADINNDGCIDLLTTGAGGVGGPSFLGTAHQLYINNCDGTFDNGTADSGIAAPHPAMMAAFGDIDNDGFVDLFITNPGSFASGMGEQALYLSNGDGTFEDISASSGINTAAGGCVVNFINYDDDAFMDLVVGNCNLLDFSSGAPVPIPGPWELWQNNGDYTFTDVATAAGLNSHPGFPMALSAADYDGDGDFDLFATGIGAAFGPAGYGITAEQVLFSNNGDGTYTDVTYAAGLGGLEWGWGANFADLDNDGDEDLLTVGSMPPMFGVIGAGLGSPGRLYENDGGSFTTAQTLGLQGQFTSGMAMGDYNGDGFVDAAICTAEFSGTSMNPADPTVYTGDGAPILVTNGGNANHSITIRLEGTLSNANGVGAVVSTKLAHVTQIKQVFAGTGFASGSSLWPTFGLGGRDEVDVKVAWPSGIVEEFDGLSADQLVTLVEGTGDQ